MLALHRRHGEAVMDVLGLELKARAQDLGKIHPDSLLGRYVGAGMDEGKRLHGVEPADEQPVLDAVDSEPCAPESPDLDPVDLLLPERLLDRNTFFEVGDGWVVGLAGTRAVLVKTSRGMRLIALLLRHPGYVFPVLQLQAILDGKEPLPGVGALPATDVTSVAALRKRVAKLREDEEDLRGIELTEQADRLREEREAIEDQLVRDLGLGGRARDRAPEVEKARSRAQKSVDRTIRSIKAKKGGMAVGRHLANAISTGHQLVYAPLDEGRGWLLDG